ncbi:hypothetical protein DdX_13409 [Ditylenchus destructor]|uniref:Uncharacterized protein n=1 Tax=Ditylenchus destructor TaxID=166010 RepID=A0AAD4R2M6_9BILA|nr:hypothetical protein DdX_13409 [Ditylenchus destructor]
MTHIRNDEENMPPFIVNKKMYEFKSHASTVTYGELSKLLQATTGLEEALARETRCSARQAMSVDKKLADITADGIKAKNFINPSLSSSPASLVLSLRSLNRYLSTPKLRQVKQQWALLSFCSWLWQSLLVLHINSAIWTSTSSKPSRRSMKRRASSNSASTTIRTSTATNFLSIKS